jgi:hypothetical protein
VAGGQTPKMKLPWRMVTEALFGVATLSLVGMRVGYKRKEPMVRFELTTLRLQGGWSSKIMPVCYETAPEEASFFKNSFSKNLGGCSYIFMHLPMTGGHRQVPGSSRRMVTNERPFSQAEGQQLYYSILS